MNLILGHNQGSIFFFHLGGAMGKAYWSSSNYDKEIIFLLWKQEKPLRPKPPPWAGPRKRGSGSQWTQGVPVFCTRAGKSAAEGEAIHLAGPSLLENRDKGQRRERRGQGTLKHLDYTWSTSPSCCQIHTQVLFRSKFYGGYKAVSEVIPRALCSSWNIHINKKYPWKTHTKRHHIHEGGSRNLFL